MIFSNAQLQSLTVPPALVLVNSNPARAGIIIGTGTTGVTFWVWPNENEITTGGILIPVEIAYVHISEEVFGELVRKQWYVSAQLATTGVLWFVETYNSEKEMVKHEKATIKSCPNNRSSYKFINPTPQRETCRIDSPKPSEYSLYDFLLNYRCFRPRD